MKATYTCANSGCKKPFEARTADRARGWARFCSKQCKAVAQERRTGQHGAYRASQHDSDHAAGMDAAEAGWDGHKGSF